jgi:hypothetical protein
MGREMPDVEECAGLLTLLQWIRLCKTQEHTVGLLGRHPVCTRAAHLQPRDCSIEPCNHLAATHLLPCIDGSQGEPSI